MDRGKRSKEPHGVKPAEYIRKNLYSFLGTSPDKKGSPCFK